MLKKECKVNFNCASKLFKFLLDLMNLLILKLEFYVFKLLTLTYCLLTLVAVKVLKQNGFSFKTRVNINNNKAG